MGVLQLVFASVAGAGALVALIVAYRRQKIAEADSVHDRTRVFNERFPVTRLPQGRSGILSFAENREVSCLRRGRAVVV